MLYKLLLSANLMGEQESQANHRAGLEVKYWKASIALLSPLSSLLNWRKNCPCVELGRLGDLICWLAKHPEHNYFWIITQLLHIKHWQSGVHYQVLIRDENQSEKVPDLLEIRWDLFTGASFLLLFTVGKLDLHSFASSWNIEPPVIYQSPGSTNIKGYQAGNYNREREREIIFSDIKLSRWLPPCV